MPTSASAKIDCNSPGEDIKAKKWHAEYSLLLLAPLDWTVAGCLIGAELVGRLLGWMAPRNVPTFPSPKAECSFVLLSWNSQSMLEESLPALLDAVKDEAGKHEVIVVDNHSTDGTDEFIRRRFPQVRMLSSERNRYFGAGTRLGIAAATRDILVLMNNDTIVQPGFLKPLLRALSGPAVFGAASRVKTAPGVHDETANTVARFTGTDIEWQHRAIPAAAQKSEYPVFWLHRGLFAVDRRKYCWLGGSDSLYDPFYMEDVDLSYRAWKVGWRCLLSLDSEVYHRHDLSIPQNGEGFLHMIVRRNQYLFFWKNINSVSMLFKYCVNSTRRRMRRARSPEIGVAREAQSFFAALKRLPLVLIKRLTLARQVIRSDREVFTTVAEAGSSL